MDVFGLGLRIKEEGAATVEASLKRLGKELLSTAAIAGGLAFAFKKFVDETGEAQAVQAQLNAALASTKGVSGQTIETLNANAVALSSLTAVSDEAIGSAQALLLTFTNIREAFPEATLATLNLARALKTDTHSAALQLGKALNDPIRGVTALTRAGVQFTESQKQVIENLVNQNKLYEAQKIVLKELETQTAKSAEAYRNTLPGAIDNLKNSFDNLFEAEGASATGFVQTINAMADALQTSTPFILDTLNLVIKGLVTVGTTAIVIGIAFVRAWNTAGNVISNFAFALKGLGKISDEEYASIAEAQMKANEEFERQDALLERQQVRLQLIRAEMLEPSALPEAPKIALPVLTPATIERVADDEEKDAFLERIKNIIALNKELEVNQRKLADVRAVEKELVAELAKANIPLERQVELQKALNDARELLNDKSQIEAQRDRIKLEVELQSLMPESVARTQALAKIKADLNSELLQENLALERQVEIRKLLAEIAKIEEPKEKEKLEKSRNASSQAFRDYYASLQKDMETFKKSFGELVYDDISTTLAESLTDGIEAGLKAAIQTGRISDLWKVMSQTMLAQIANMMVNVALAYLGYAQMIARIQEFLVLNPYVAIAAAAAMLAFSYSQGGKSQSGNMVVGGGTGGLATGLSASSQRNVPSPIIFGSTSSSSAVGMTPRTPMNVTVIGPNDPSAQRAIQELMTKANSRGRIG